MKGDKYLGSCTQIKLQMQVEKHIGLHVKCTFFSSYFIQDVNLLTDFSKLPISNLIKIYSAILEWLTQTHIQTEEQM
jgi:hypothetical protein